MTKIYLDNIKKGEELNCYNTVATEHALTEAEKSDIRRKEGKHKSPFDGIPIGIKDLFVRIISEQPHLVVYCQILCLHTSQQLRKIVLMQD